MSWPLSSHDSVANEAVERKIPGFLRQYYWCLTRAILLRSREPMSVFTEYMIFALTGSVVLLIRSWSMIAGFRCVVWCRRCVMSQLVSKILLYICYLTLFMSNATKLERGWRVLLRRLKQATRRI